MPVRLGEQLPAELLNGVSELAFPLLEFRAVVGDILIQLLLAFRGELFLFECAAGGYFQDRLAQVELELLDRGEEDAKLEEDERVPSPVVDRIAGEAVKLVHEVHEKPDSLEAVVGVPKQLAK